jgi:signal transduction histidine kinase
VISAAGARPVAVEVPHGLIVSVSADVVRAVVAPLIDNAERHARSGVRVEATATETSVTLSVIDDGPGFAAADVERAFEAGASGGSGHGLGLAVVRRIATAAGLEVKAIASGRGEVAITLPRTPV